MSDPQTRPATPAEDHVVAVFTARHAEPVQLLAAALAAFQADLAIADGPAYNPMAVDSRLAALTLRLVARLAEAHRSDRTLGYDRELGFETTALDDFIEYLEEAAADALRLETPGHAS